MADFKFDIVEHLGVISENPKGWTKELNLVSWNGARPKFDLRDMGTKPQEKMGKGITLSNEEFEALKDLMSKL